METVKKYFPEQRKTGIHVNLMMLYPFENCRNLAIFYGKEFKLPTDRSAAHFHQWLLTLIKKVN